MHTILCHLRRHNNDIQLRSLKDLRGNLKKHFNDLCHLAFTMTIKSKLVVTQDDMGIIMSQDASPEDEKSLGLLIINRTAHLSGLHNTYSFLHLMFQEFLTAY